jgi:calcineurin-like phosphoesterase family protein
LLDHFVIGLRHNVLDYHCPHPAGCDRQIARVDVTEFYTADLHLGHENIIKYCSRPFSNVSEMDKTIIDNWNYMVSSNDIVYVLGDFTLKNLAVAMNYLLRLNGNIKLLPGSHDQRWINDLTDDNVLKTKTGFACTVEPLFVIDRRPMLTLCHYAMRKWPL